MNCRQEHHSVKALHYLQHTLVVCLRQTMLIKPTDGFIMRNFTARIG